MARIKWEDRKYNGDLTMKEVARHGASRLGVIASAAHVRHSFSEGGKQSLQAQASLRATAKQSLQAQASLRATAKQSPGHRGDCFVATAPRNDIGISVKGPSVRRNNKLIIFLRSLLFLFGQAPDFGQKSPGFRIRTRSRILEIPPKLNISLFRPNQAPDSGSRIKTYRLHNLLLYKAFNTSMDAITAWTERILSPASRIVHNVPRLGAWIAGTLAAGSLFIGTVKDAEAAPGDFVSGWVFSHGQSRKPVGAAYDNLEDKLYFIDNKDQKVYSREPPVWSDASENTVLNLEAGDEYFGLGFGRIAGVPHLAAANITDCELEIYDINTGTQVNSKTMPGTPGGPGGPRGVCFDGDWEVFILSGQPSMNKYNKINLNLQREVNNFIDQGMYNIKDSELTFDSDRNLFYMIGNGDTGFYTFRVSNDNASDVNYFNFSMSPSGDYTGAGFNESNLELMIMNDISSCDGIYIFEGYDAPPTPNGTGIFRPNSGLWAINGVTRTYFGGSNDIPIYDDFDGDSIKDIGIFRPSSGLWAIKGITRAYFGSNSDTPIPGDYDGDNTTDIGIFRKNSGLWAIRGLTRAYFGGSDDIPVPGDYDGSGDDIGIFRPNSGLWALRGITRAYFGGSNDIPVPGDYDGTIPKLDEIAIFRENSGLWAIRGLTRNYFGGLGDEPVPADYNKDGITNQGVFRDSSGLWAVRGLTRIYFGGVGDIPVMREPAMN